MVFSDSTNYQGIIQDIDFLLFASSAVFNTDYALADRVRNVNIALDEVVTELYKADPNYKWDDTTNTDLPCATLDLTANQDHYAMLDSAQVVHRVRVKDRNGEFYTLEPALRSELTDYELNNTGSPTKYYKMGGAIFPVVTPDYGYADGIELEFQRGGNYFTASDTTKEPGFNPQFHQYLSVGASLRYAISNGMENKANQLRAEKERIRNSIREHYERRSPDMKPKMKLKRKVGNYGL